jgi:hypothetical protein
MFFAKVDVCIAVHPRFCAAGPAAVGYWVAALAYSCGQELDGRVPAHAIGAILALGPNKGRALCAKLVSVGLFERDGDGYVIAKFAEKNATKAELDARRKETAGRVNAHRQGRPGNALHGSLQEPPVTRVVLNSLSPDLRSPSSPIPPDLRLTPEARASAETLGVRDVDGEWVKFVAHHRANGTRAADFYALWTKWSVMARNYERRDRERDARRAPAAANPSPAPYHAVGPRRREVDLAAQLEARLAAAKDPTAGRAR